MRRRIARFLFVFLLGTIAMILGVVTSMTLTPPGRALLARTVSRVLDRIVIGQVDVGAISGSFLYDLTLEDLVVRDTSGELLADLPRVEVNYRLPNLLAGQVVLERGPAGPARHPADQAPQRPDELRGGARPREGKAGRDSRRWSTSTT